MTLILELSPAEEASLAAVAAESGLAPAVLARQIVTEHLPALQNGALQNGALQNGRWPPCGSRSASPEFLAAEGSFADDSWDSVAELHRDRQIDKAKEEAWAKEYMA